MKALLSYWLSRQIRRLDEADEDLAKAQAVFHGRLAKSLTGTAVGQLQDPRIFDDLASYRRFVRPTTYQDIRGLVEAAMASRQPGAFERGATQAFGHTSSGKMIPFTRDHVRTFQSFSALALGQAAIGLGLRSLLDHPTLMIQSSLEVSRSEAGILTGYSSGVMMQHTPWLVQQRLLPHPKHLLAPKLEDRLAAIEAALLHRRPSAITGIPEHVVGVLRHLLSGPNAEAVREALSRITVYAWSGTSLGPYKSFLTSLLAPGARFIDAVSATEGAIGLHAGEEGIYRLAATSSLFLFSEPGNPEERYLAHELEAGRRYEVWLGTFAGLLGYRIGDVIEVVSTSPLRFRLVPRSLDVHQTWELLGRDVTDFCLYHPPSSDSAVVLVESRRHPGKEALAALARLAGVGEVKAKLLEEGALSRAALRGTLEGLVKRPWMHRRPEVHDLLSAYV